MPMNASKTKFMSSNGENITLRGNESWILEQVESFLYLGVIITWCADCSTQIKARLVKASKILTELKTL